MYCMSGRAGMWNNQRTTKGIEAVIFYFLYYNIMKDTKEKLSKFWEEQTPEMKEKMTEIAQTPQWHEFMYALIEAEYVKRGEDLNEDKIKRLTDMAIWFILAK